MDFRCAETVIANSRAVRQKLLEMEPGMTEPVVLPPAFDATTVRDLRQPVMLSACLHPIPHNARFILCIGRLIRRKGFDLAIDAFRQLAEDFRDVHLVIAGEGRERAHLEEIVQAYGLSGRVHCVGSVVGADKKSVIQKCEFLVMPNRECAGDMEGFGIVFLEAALCGKAVIGGRNGGVPEAVEDGVTGILVDTSQTDAVAAAMRDLLSNASLRDRMGAAGAARVLREHLWDHQVGRLLGLLEPGRSGGLQPD